MAWYLDNDGDQIELVVEDRRVGGIRCIRAGVIGKLEVILKSDGQELELQLADFQAEASALSSEFVGAETVSRTEFIKKWDKICAEKQSLKQPAKITAHGVVDQVLRDNFIGTVDVHLMNLIAPHSSRAARDVDFGHVGKLEESYLKHNMGQIVLLVGMATEDLRGKDLTVPGTTGIEVLGGNHSRLALQSLNEKGALLSPIVKVNLYKPLPPTEALAIGLQHNVILEEKTKKLTFVDKVKLMRDLRPSKSMSGQEVTQWKDMLCIIFRAENRRKLQSNLNHHLQMAKVSDDVFVKVVQANARKEVTDKFFKNMLRIDNEEMYHVCLDTLLSEGQQAFQKKVGEYIEQGLVRKKKRTREDSSSDENLSVESNDGELTRLKEMVMSLQEEKEQLKKELESLRDQHQQMAQNQGKPSTTEDLIKWNAGDIVQAKWSDNNYYDAKVQKVEALYHVVFLEDNKRRKVTGGELRGNRN